MLLGSRWRQNLLKAEYGDPKYHLLLYIISEKLFNYGPCCQETSEFNEYSQLEKRLAFLCWWPHFLSQNDWGKKGKQVRLGTCCRSWEKCTTLLLELIGINELIGQRKVIKCSFWERGKGLYCWICSTVNSREKKYAMKWSCCVSFGHLNNCWSNMKVFFFFFFFFLKIFF